MNPRALIIGYGNPLRSDDVAGRRVAEELSHSPLPDGVDVITQHQLTPELASYVSQADLVLFLDSTQDGTPGEISYEIVKRNSTSTSSSHEFSPSSILSFSEELYGRSPQAFLVSICGKCFDHGESLSPEVESNLPRMRALVLELINKPSALAKTANG